MADKGRLEIEIKLAQEELRKGLADTKKAIGGLEGKIDLNLNTDKAQSAVRSLLDEIKIGFAREIGAKAFNSLIQGANLAKDQIVQFGQGVLATGSNFEKIEVAFATFLGSAAKAKIVLADLVNFAATTPFELPEIQSAGRSLLAFGFTAEELIPTLRKLGDISAGVSQPIGEIAAIFGKAKTQGRLFQEDINQLTGRGIPILQELAKQFGVTEGEVRKLTESGKIGFDQIDKAFTAMAGSGGKFFNLMEEQSKTVGGKISNLNDTVTKFQKQLFDNTKPAFAGVVDLLGAIGTELNKAAQKDLPALNQQAEEFSASLQKNPELARQIGEELSKASIVLSGEILNAAKQLTVFLADNPGYLTEMVKGATSFLSLLAQSAAKALELASYLAKAGENFAADNTFTAAGKKLTPGEVGIQNTLNPKDVAEFQRRAIDNNEGQGLFYDEEAVRKVAQELALARTKAAEFGETGKIAFDAFSQGAAAAFTSVKTQVAEVPKLTAESSKQAIAKLDEANKAAETAVKTAVAGQIAAVKELGLTREVETKRIAEIEKAAAVERVAAIQAEIEQVKALRASGQISPEAEQQKLLTLNSELASANLARIEKVRAAEAAVRAEVIAGIEAQALKAKIADNERIASADKVLNSLRREQDLFSARSGLEAAQGDLAKVRLENQLKIVEAIGNEKAAAQLKLQIQQQEIANQERVFASQLKSLEITQQIKAAELSRQKILDEIAIKESEIALSKLKQKEGVSKDELALQQQIIEANREKLALTDKAIADQSTFNQYAKDELLTKQAATREAQQTNIAAAALKETFGATNSSAKEIATAFNSATNAAGNLNSAIAGMTENTRALVQQALAIKEAFRQGATAFQGSATGLGGTIQTAAKGADGIIGSVGGQTIAQKEAIAASQGLTNEFERAAFLFNARAKEIKDAGLASTEKINIGGAELDFAKAGELFGRAASKALDGLVSKNAQLELANRVAIANVGSAVAGRTAEEISNNVSRIQRERLSGRLEAIPIGGFASGTKGQPIRSGIALVGEEGPELINVTPGGTHVLSNPNTRKIMGFAQGTGGFKDFVQARAIKINAEISTILESLNRAGNPGIGGSLSVQTANDLAFAMSAIADSRRYVGEISQQLAAGEIQTARANAEEYARIQRKVAGNYGVFAREVNQVIGLISGLLNARSDIPSFASGVMNFRGGLAEVHNGELIRMARGTDVIPKGQWARDKSDRAAPGANVTTKIENLTISAPDPTGEAVRFLQENSRQSMRLARV